MRSLRWTPFYYFHEAPEVFAVQKLAYQSVMYAPVGVLYWAYCYDRPGALRRAWIPVGIAVILTAIMGFGRIMLYRRVGPDPTNLLIAALAAYLAFTATQFLGGLAAGSPRTFDRATPAAAPLPGLLSRRALATVLTLVTIVATASYPFGAAGNLTLGLAAFGLLAFSNPRLWLVVVPIAIPLLDRARITGPLLVDEMDLILVVSLIAWLWREPYPYAPKHTFGAARYLIAAFLVSATISAWIGWQLIPPEQWHSLASFDGPQNVIRQLKGYWLPLLLLPCAVAQLRRDEQAFRSLAFGISVALAYTATIVAWERYLFPGLFDLSAAFRAGGPFSSMSTGGASLDAFLVLGLPFAFFLVSSPRRLTQAAGAGIIALATYAVIVTFTRATYLAVGASVMTVGLLTLMAPGKNRKLPSTLALGFVIATLATAAILPSTHMRSRFERTGADASGRIAELRQAVSVIGDNSRWLGSGVGTFPWANIDARTPRARPGRAVISQEKNRRFVRLFGGQYVYFDQRVAIEPAHTYTLQAKVRASSDAKARAFICEKHLMNSATCVSTAIPSDSSGQWRTAKVQIDSGAVGAPQGRLGLLRPVYLTISPPETGAWVDLANLTLRDQHGHDLLRNGDFRSGALGWFFTGDDHLAWHLKNLWAFLFFEQGLVGVLGFGLLTVYVAVRLMNAVGASANGALPLPLTQAPMLLMSALVSVHVLALTDAILDAPRIAILFWLVYGAALGISRPLRANLTPATPAPQT